MRVNSIERFVGQTFNRLTVLSVANRTFKTGRVAYAACRCLCGVEKTIPLQSIRIGATKSCGCQRHAWRTRPDA